MRRALARVATSLAAAIIAALQCSSSTAQQSSFLQVKGDLGAKLQSGVLSFDYRIDTL
jgi:hypothetical protein